MVSLKCHWGGRLGSYSLPSKLCDTSADYPTSKPLAAVHICLWGQCNMDAHFSHKPTSGGKSCGLRVCGSSPKVSRGNIEFFFFHLHLSLEKYTVQCGMGLVFVFAHTQVCIMFNSSVPNEWFNVQWLGWGVEGEGCIWMLNIEAIKFSIHSHAFMWSACWPSGFTQSHLNFNENMKVTLGDKKLSGFRQSRSRGWTKPALVRFGVDRSDARRHLVPTADSAIKSSCFANEAFEYQMHVGCTYWLLNDRKEMKALMCRGAAADTYS